MLNYKNMDKGYVHLIYRQQHNYCIFHNENTLFMVKFYQKQLHKEGTFLQKSLKFVSMQSESQVWSLMHYL